MMHDIEYLRKQWALPGVVTVDKGRHGFPRLTLSHSSGSRAEIYLYGAHVTSWKNASGRENIFVSRQACFEVGRPIRGGIPVVFPQFGDGPLPKHGLARIAMWNLQKTGVYPDGTVSVILRLEATPETLRLWPCTFSFEFILALGAMDLTVTMRITNTGANPMTYCAALHTYFAVTDIRKTWVEGLKGGTLIDSLRHDIHEMESRERIGFDGEVDRVYVQAPDTIRLLDQSTSPASVVDINKTNMPDAVVWNPWIEKARRLEDLGDDEYVKMVCVETGIIQDSWTLMPGETWVGSTRFTASVL